MSFSCSTLYLPTGILLGVMGRTFDRLVSFKLFNSSIKSRCFFSSLQIDQQWLEGRKPWEGHQTYRSSASSASASISRRCVSPNSSRNQSFSSTIRPISSRRVDLMKLKQKTLEGNNQASADWRISDIGKELDLQFPFHNPRITCITLHKHKM